MSEGGNEVAQITVVLKGWMKRCNHVLDTVRGQPTRGQKTGGWTVGDTGKGDGEEDGFSFDLTTCVNSGVIY